MLLMILQPGVLGPADRASRAILFGDHFRTTLCAMVNNKTTPAYISRSTDLDRWTTGSRCVSVANP